jgi:U1 small nuclear ribonucleoprotein C
MNKSRKVYKKRGSSKKNRTRRCVYTDEGKKYLKIMKVTKEFMKKNMPKNIKGVKGMMPPPPDGMPMPPPDGMPMPPPDGMPMPPPNGMPMPPPNGMPMPPPNGMPMPPPNDLAQSKGSKRRKNVKSQKKLKPKSV